MVLREHLTTNQPVRVATALAAALIASPVIVAAGQYQKRVLHQ